MFIFIHVLLLYSPSGKLVQIEHALTAVGSGQTSLGIKGNVISFVDFCNFLLLMFNKRKFCNRNRDVSYFLQVMTKNYLNELLL